MNTDNPQKNRHGLTEQEARELGSAEANTWTITPPGGEPMTLDQHAKYQEAKAKEREEDLQIMRDTMAQEAAERAAGSVTE
jgi:hypothetical protein